jgi:hypothetical protein
MSALSDPLSEAQGGGTHSKIEPVPFQSGADDEWADILHSLTEDIQDIKRSGRERETLRGLVAPEYVGRHRAEEDWPDSEDEGVETEEDDG